MSQHIYLTVEKDPAKRSWIVRRMFTDGRTGLAYVCPSMTDVGLCITRVEHLLSGPCYDPRWAEMVERHRVKPT